MEPGPLQKSLSRWPCGISEAFGSEGSSFAQSAPCSRSQRKSHSACLDAVVQAHGQPTCTTACSQTPPLQFATTASIGVQCQLTCAPREGPQAADGAVKVDGDDWSSPPPLQPAGSDTSLGHACPVKEPAVGGQQDARAPHLQAPMTIGCGPGSSLAAEDGLAGAGEDHAIQAAESQLQTAITHVETLLHSRTGRNLWRRRSVSAGQSSGGHTASLGPASSVPAHQGSFGGSIGPSAPEALDRVAPDPEEEQQVGRAVPGRPTTRHTQKRRKLSFAFLPEEGTGRVKSYSTWDRLASLMACGSR